jgi:hypothetical protein
MTFWEFVKWLFVAELALKPEENRIGQLREEHLKPTKFEYPTISKIGK